MQVKILHRNREDFISSTPGHIKRYYRNRDPDLHPFARAREYTRALVATKLDKIFAKPLISSLDGHTDSIKAITKCRGSLTDVFSGSCDGEIRFWNVVDKKCSRSIRAHDGFVRGLCCSNDDQWLFSCGDDKKIKQWSIEQNMNPAVMDLDEINNKGNLNEEGLFDIELTKNLVKPQTVFHAKSILTSLDYNWSKNLLVSAGETVDVWDMERSTPIYSFDWDCDSLFCVRFNPSEHSLLASTAGDNSIGLYDLRGGCPLRKVILQMASNALCWNPFEPMHFTVANEDHNLYTFDLRNLKNALVVHKDFVNAVMDIDYSPTGLEFVAASFDRTIRIFERGGYRSRDVYHTKRMHTALACRFSNDGNYIFSGSADMCLRIWKANASSPLGLLSSREKMALSYRNKLKQKYNHMKEIKRISRHHHVPKLIKKLDEKKRIMENAERRKELNRINHSKPGSLPPVKETFKAVVNEIS